MSIIFEFMSFIRHLFSRDKKKSENDARKLSFSEIRIHDVIRETKDAITIFFERPKGFAYKAGQFITIRTNIDGQQLSREYSFSSAPTEDRIAVTIKRIDNGLFSTYANNSFRPGDLLEIKGPQGFFTLSEKSLRPAHYVGIAGGSGITPIFSILKTALSAHTQNTFTLYFANRDINSIIFHQQLEALRQTYAGRLRIRYILEDIDDISDPNLYDLGRIDRTKLQKYLAHDLSEISVENYFLCGPREMIDNVRYYLREAGVSDEKIKFELFSKANTALSGDVSQTVVAESVIEFTYRGETKTVHFTDNTKSILDTILDAGYDVPYSCLGGTCGTCNCKVQKGNVTYENMIALNDKQVSEGYILSCSAFPASEKIHIDFDDYIL